jgi:branched-chain amino acid transport system substrate-binding protein
MKGKSTILLVMFALLLTGTMFINITPTRGFAGQIKIGIIGPVGLPHWSPGMWEAAQMARDEINGAGGVNVSNSFYEIVLVQGDEHAYPSPDPTAARNEMIRLCDPGQEDCDFVIGGFRTECTTAMIEVAADYSVPFIIDGASTDELISDTVGTNYARYKYLFRINPVNSTMLFKTIAGALAYYLIPAKLLPLYGQDLDGNATTPPQVRVAVITEDLAWTLTMHTYLTHPAIYPSILGPYANVTYSGRIPDGTTDCTPWLTDVITSGARLLIHVFSGVSGVPFIAQWRALNVSALPVGINVLGQLETHWTTTGGACEYETILNFAGTRTPIVPGLTDVFWDNFVNLTGAWPLYTAWGAYDGLYALTEAIEANGSTDKDALVTFWEDPSYERQGLAGKFKFTPIHDVFSNEPGPVWTQGYVRALLAQWLSARMEVVCPIDQVYSKKWAIPPWMYPLIEDINYDGVVDMRDIGTAARAFGSTPGHPRWEKEADINFDDQIDMRDIGSVARKFGTSITLPLP